jgi:DNA repair protein RecO (recombination protein O)
MPVICAEGIVTRYANYRESDRILSIFTIQNGRIDAKARGCRKPQSPLVNACQPFVFGQFEIFTGKERATINACDIRETFYPIREDYERYSIGSVMLRLCHDAAPENEPNEALFSLLYHSLSFLAYGVSNPQDLFCCFLARFLNTIGYRPSITACAQCGRDIRSDAIVRFSPRGGAVCNACVQHGEPVSKTALEGMRRMLAMEDADMDRVKLSDAVRGEIFRALSTYTENSVEFGARALDMLKGLQTPSQHEPAEKNDTNYD